MLNIYVLIPTVLKDHAPEILAKWKAKGYKLGLFVNPETVVGVLHDLLIRAEYPGVWNAWNALARAAVACGADVCILAGDDMEPDPNYTAQEIAEQYLARFPAGEGVMQPCGDPQGIDDSGRPAAARICGSPWIGREWIKRAYRGSGPVNGAYNAFYADEELFHVAGLMGKLWMESRLSQFHRHHSWGHLPIQDYHKRNQRRWLEDKKLFEKRLEDGFPESSFL